MSDFKHMTEKRSFKATASAGRQHGKIYAGPFTVHATIKLVRHDLT